MPASPVPTTEIGYAQAPNYYWWLYQDESTPELVWPQSVRVYDDMRRTDSQVGSILRAVNLLVLRTPWRIDPNGARDEVVQLVADDFGLPIVGQSPKPPPRTKDRFSWKDHLAEALLMLPLGHSYFEQVYRVDESGNRAHLRKLALRPAKSIDRIDVAPDGGLVSIKQCPTAAYTTPQPIPVNRLVAYIHAKEGANWLGTSILRNCYKNWLLKDRLLRVQAQTIERNGMGIPLYKDGPDGTAASMAAGLAMAKAWRAGEAAGSAIPHEAELTLVGVSGTLPDAEPAIRYHDESIAKTVLAHFLNLGQQMGTGSYALGTTLGDFFTLGVQTVGQQIADVANMHVVEDLVDVNWGPKEPAPRLVFDEIGSRQAATAQAIKILIDAGVIRADDVLEETARQQYGLPPRDPDSARTPPGTASAAEPTTSGSMGAESVAASTAVAAKFNPSELRVETGDHGGEWTSGGLLKDALKLGDRIDLAPGESLAGSEKLNADFGHIRLAAVDGPHGRSLRFGAGDSSFATRDDPAGPWRAGPDESVRKEAERAPLREELAALDAIANPTPEQEARFAELDDMDLSEAYATGYTAKLAPAGAAQLRDALDDANKRAKAAMPAHLAAWDALPDSSRDFPYADIAQGSIPGEWGDVHYETFIEEPELGPQTYLWVVPKGASSDDIKQQGINATLDASESAKLVRLLGKMADGKPVQASFRDVETDALSAAISAFLGEVRAAAHWDPSLHPRDSNGHFRSTFAKVMHALDGWSKGHGSDDPLPESDFNREQLRKVAVQRGIKLRRGASRPEIHDALLAHIKGKAREDRNAPKPSAKFTLKGPNHRNRDVAVYTNKDGSTVTLYDENDRGEIGSHPLVQVDDLAGLEKWADDNGEKELSAWARSEQGLKPKKATKRAPAKAPAVPAKGPDLTGANGLSSDPATRATQVENRIRQAYERTATPRDAAAQTGGWTTMTRLRGELGDTPRADVDAALDRMIEDPGVTMQAELNQKALTPADRAAAVSIGPEPRDLLKIDDPSPHPLPTPAVPAKSLGEQVRQAYEELLAAKPDPSNPWISLADIRDRFPDVDRATLDAELKRLDREHSDIHVFPVANGKSLTKRERDAAVTFGGQDSHAMSIEDMNAAWDLPAVPAKKATPRKARPPLDAAATIAGLRGQSSDDIRDALDLHTIPELKSMMPTGMAKTGKKRDLVDRLTEHLSGDIPKADGGQGPSSVAARTAEVVRLAAQGEPTETRHLGGGSGAELFTYADGSKLVKKNQSLRDNDAEQLGALVGDAVGILTPATHREGDRLYMEYMPGTVGTKVRRVDRDAVFASPDGKLIGVTDMLLLNSDRHPGNWIQRDDGRIQGIDHGFSFEMKNDTSAYGSPFARQFFTTPERFPASIDIDPAVVAAMEPRLQALRPEFERMGRADWFDAMMARFQLIRAAAESRP